MVVISPVMWPHPNWPYSVLRLRSAAKRDATVARTLQVADTKCLDVYYATNNDEFWSVHKVNGEKLTTPLYLVKTYEGYSTLVSEGMKRDKGAKAEAVLNALKAQSAANSINAGYGLKQIKDAKNDVLFHPPDKAIAAYDQKPTVGTTTDGLDICFFRRKFIMAAKGFGNHVVKILEAEAMRETQERIKTRYQIHPSWPYGIIRLRSEARANAPVMKTFDDPKNNSYFRFIVDHSRSTSDFWYVRATASGMNDVCKNEASCGLWVIKRYEGHLTLAPVQIATVVLLDSIIGSNCSHKGRCQPGCPFGFHKTCGYQPLAKHVGNLQTMYKVLDDAHRKPEKYQIVLELDWTYKGEYEDGYIAGCQP